MRQRPDRQGVDERPDPHRPAQRRARREDGELDRRAHRAQRPPARGEPGHEPVARARPETRADVQAGRDPVQHDAADQQRGARGGAGGRLQRAEHDLDDDADHDDVADRPEPRALAQRDPEEEDERAHEAHPRARADPGPARQALVQDVPRVVAQRRQQDEAAAEAVEREAGVELREATDEAIVPEESDHGSIMRDVDLS